MSHPGAATYVSLPVTVEAMQVTKPYKAVAEWSGGKVQRWCNADGDWVTAVIVGRAWAHQGDWVVANSMDSTFTVMSDDQFRSSYQPKSASGTRKSDTATARHSAGGKDE